MVDEASKEKVSFTTTLDFADEKCHTVEACGGLVDAESVRKAIIESHELPTGSEFELLKIHGKSIKPLVPELRVCSLTACLEQKILNGKFSIALLNSMPEDQLMQENCIDKTDLFIVTRERQSIGEMISTLKDENSAKIGTSEGHNFNLYDQISNNLYRCHHRQCRKTFKTPKALFKHTKNHVEQFR